jgi:hypothetical protein
MKIDPQTKENFKTACLNQSAVAKSLGVSVSLFNQVLNGTYPHMDGEDAQKAVAFLKERGLLVLKNVGKGPAVGTIARSKKRAITVH